MRDMSLLETLIIEKWCVRFQGLPPVVVTNENQAQ